MCYGWVGSQVSEFFLKNGNIGRVLPLIGYVQKKMVFTLSYGIRLYNNKENENLLSSFFCYLHQAQPHVRQKVCS